MNARDYLQSHYERLGLPELANFTLSDLSCDIIYQFGAFVLADDHGQVVLIRRTPIEQYPGIENYWWIPGGAREAGETLDNTAVREFREETGLTCIVQRILLAQLAQERPFIAVFFRGCVVNGALSSDADPDSITAEAALFPGASVPFDKLWTDADKILLARESFTRGPIDALLDKSGLRKAAHSSEAGRSGDQ